MATQKAQLADVQVVAWKLGATVTVRKNLYGEYSTLVRYEGRPYLQYLADSFADGIATAQLGLAEIAKEQAKAERIAQAKYDRELQTALDQASTILALVGCRVEIDGLDTVTLYSPKTGSHSLNMKRGVRPVSDLIAHVCGFAEQQTHRQSKVGFARILNEAKQWV